MPPKRFEGKFGIPPSHPVESLLTSALYRLPESVSSEKIDSITKEIVTKVQEGGQQTLTPDEIKILQLKLVRYYENNRELAPLDISTLVDALVESPKFLQDDRGSIEKLLEIHEMKTLQKIAEIRRRRAEITAGNTNELNPYENLFETRSGEFYLARLLNMPHLEDESSYMSHCVGTSTSYINKIKRGDVEIFSFRDTHTHEPVVTIEYDTHSHRLLQVKKFNDQLPTLKDPYASDLLEAIERLGESTNDKGEQRIVASKEVTHLKRLLALKEKRTRNEPFTRDELLFLYEVNEPIQGFDIGREPMIDAIRALRARTEDIKSMCDCSPEHLATNFTDLSATTEVFCEDTGTKLTLFDFREEKNKAKFPQLLELAQKLKEVGSPARPDLSFEGGIVRIQFQREMIQSKETAFKYFESADNNSPFYILQEWREREEWQPPTGEQLEIVVLSYDADPNTRQLSDEIVADMDRLGLRPLTLEEMTLAGIVEQKFTKTPSKYFVGLTPYSTRVPVLLQSVGKRHLYWDLWDIVWDNECRFLCVRKS